MQPDRATVPLVDRLTELSPFTTIALALTMGALSGLGHAPFGVWPLTILGLCGAGLLFRAASVPRRAAWIGWAFATGSYLVSLHWIVEPFLVDVARHGWMAPFALVFMAGGLALFFAAAFWGAHRWGGLALLAVALAVAELARGYMLSGFPWNLVGYVWIDTPVAQLAVLIGPYGLSLFTLVVALLPAALIGQNARSLAIGLGLLAVLVSGAFGYGLMVQAAAESDIQDSTDRPLVRVIQPNAPQHLKWHPDHMQLFFDRAVAATAARPTPDLIVWPETSVPALLNYADETLDYVVQQAPGASIVLGAQRRDTLQNYYNSLVIIDGATRARQTYDKHYLVPFGEYLPLAGLLGNWGLSALADQFGGGYSAGAGPQVLDTGAAGQALPLICYEAVFPQNLRGVSIRPDYLLQITNDAWFGGFSGPFQHLVQARFRAIEQGLPMVRAANTGVSAIINPQGQILASLDLNTDGYVDARLPLAAAPTPYSKYGDVPIAVILLLLAAMLSALPRNKH